MSALICLSYKFKVASSKLKAAVLNFELAPLNLFPVLPQNQQRRRDTGFRTSGLKPLQNFGAHSGKFGTTSGSFVPGATSERLMKTCASAPRSSAGRTSERVPSGAGGKPSLR